MDVRARVAMVAERTQGLASARMLATAGVPRMALSRAVSAGAVVRVLPRAYAVTPLPTRPRWVVTELGVDPRYVQQVRAALLSRGPSFVARGRTAAALHGWGLLVEPARSVQLAVPHGFGSVRGPGLEVSQRRRSPFVLVGGGADDGLRVTTPVQTVIDCACELPLVEAVVLCDSALRAGSLDLEELQRAVRALPGVRDVGRARRVLGLADARSESVLESVVRVHLVRAGIRSLTPQVVVRTSVGPVRVDLADEGAGLVIELDGARWHLDPGRDQARDNALAETGRRVLRYTWAAVVRDPSAVVRQVIAALGVTDNLQSEGGRAQRTA